MTNTVSITVSIWDFGCLPNLLAKEIAAVEHRIGRDPHLADDLHEQYLGQLRACLKAVHAVSKAPMSAAEAEAIKAFVLGVPVA